MNAQINFQNEVNLIGLYSNNENSPFWFYTNKRGRISEETSLASWFTSELDYQINDDTKLKIGGGFYFRMEYSSNL